MEISDTKIKEMKEYYELMYTLSVTDLQNSHRHATYAAGMAEVLVGLGIMSVEESLSVQTAIMNKHRNWG